jgi:hypothetical protein
MSLSVCIALNCFASSSAALDEAAAEFEAIFPVLFPRIRWCKSSGWWFFDYRDSVIVKLEPWKALRHRRRA